jgi:LysW-gamma-L-lysine carboxypeptidase
VLLFDPPCKGYEKKRHSSTPWLYENALDKAYELWMQIKNSYTLNQKETPFNSISVCLTKISGGQANSVIPFETEMYIDVRIPPQFTSGEVLGDTLKIIDKYKMENPQVRVKATMVDSVEPFEVDKSSPLVRALSFSIRKILNKPAMLLRKTGTGDMNILGKAMVLPIVTYGPGDSHLDHTLDEHIVISEYLDSIQIFKETILKLVELHNNRNGKTQTGESS